MEHAKGLIEFINASPSPFHAVASGIKRLSQAGFQFIDEGTDWRGIVGPGGKFFTVRANTSIIAFAVGSKFTGNKGFAIAASHTDSPTMHLKPRSASSKGLYNQVAVGLYGGGRWVTWFDRDLSIAGSVCTQKSGHKVEQKLIFVNRPILRIPTVAIHLDTSRDVIDFNKETHLLPILGQVEKQIHDVFNEPGEETKSSPAAQKFAGKHDRNLIKLIHDELDLDDSEEILDFDLVLFDTQKATLAGITNEYIYAPRLDNLGSLYSSMTGFIDSMGSLKFEEGIRVLASFDHEEVGSESAQGAKSNFLPSILEKIVTATETSSTTDSDRFSRIIRQSFLLSQDMAHAFHPNYASMYDTVNRPSLNRGIVLKVNANARYMSDAPSRTLMTKIAEKANCSLQNFSVSNETPCGSTIGPSLASRMGIRTIDAGIPQLSMHSIREMCGSRDIKRCVDLNRVFFEGFTETFDEVYSNFIPSD